MSGKSLKILAFFTTVTGLVLTIAKDYVEDKKLDEKIDERLDQKLNTALLAEPTKTEEA